MQIRNEANEKAAAKPKVILGPKAATIGPESAVPARIEKLFTPSYRPRERARLAGPAASTIDVIRARKKRACPSP